MHLWSPRDIFANYGALIKMTTKLKHVIVRLLHCNIFEYVSFPSCEDVHHSLHVTIFNQGRKIICL
jgi:hypothetical protein